MGSNGIPPPDGVYVVQLHPDVTGLYEHVVWAFTEEADASKVCEALKRLVGHAWVTYEPVSHHLGEEHLVEYLKVRFGVTTEAEVRAILDAGA